MFRANSRLILFVNSRFVRDNPQRNTLCPDVCLGICRSSSLWVGQEMENFLIATFKSKTSFKWVSNSPELVFVILVEQVHYFDFSG